MYRAASVLLFLAAGALAGTVAAEPIAYAVSSSDDLYRVDLATGVATLVGDGTLGSDMEALSFDPATGELYGLNDSGDELLRIDPATGMGTVIGSLGQNVDEGALAISAAGQAIFSDEDGDTYEVDLASGATTFIGDSSIDTDNLAFVDGRLLGVDRNDDDLYEIDLSTANATLIGPLGVSTTSQHGLSYDARTGFLYLGDGNGDIFRLDPDTGSAALVSSVTFGDIAGLAIVPFNAAEAVPLAGWWLSALAVALLGAWKQRSRGRFRLS